MKTCMPGLSLIIRIQTWTALISFTIIFPCFFRSFSIWSLAWVIWLLIGYVSWPAAAWTMWSRLVNHSQLRMLPEIPQQVYQKKTDGENNTSISCYSINEYWVAKFKYNSFFSILERTLSFFLPILRISKMLSFMSKENLKLGTNSTIIRNQRYI